jgi:SAM-dependent methyltransferase
MTSTHIDRLVTPLILVALLVAVDAAAQTPAQYAADAERLTKALDLRAGAVVAELGAGDGALTILIAKAVGESGRVFSNEVSEARRAQIAKAVEEAGLKNVTVIAGRDTGAGLADQCCDAVFLRDVYHHFSDPAAMNRSILNALRPGGWLAVLDFGPPPGAESVNPADRDEDGHHGITPATLERELTAAGLEVVATETYGFRSSLTIARRPLQPCPTR